MMRQWVQGLRRIGSFKRHSRTYFSERFFPDPAFQGPYSEFHAEKTDESLETLWNNILASGKAVHSKRVVQEWETAGNVPTRNIMSNILLRLCARSRFKDAYWFARFLDITSTYELQETDKLLRVDIVCHMGRPFGEAESRFNNLLNKDETAYLMLLEGYCDAMVVKQAESLMQEMLSLKVVTSSRAFTMMLRMYVRYGDGPKAIQTLNLFESLGLVPDAHMLALMLAHRFTVFKYVNVVGIAQQALEKLKVDHLNRREIMRVHGHLRDVDAVDECWKLTVASPPVLPIDYLAAINAYDLVGQVQKAEDVHNELLKVSPEIPVASHWISMLRMYSRHRMMEKAEEVLKKVKLTTENGFLQGHPMIQGYLKNKEFDKALDCFRRFASSYGRRPIKLVEECMVKLIRYLAKKKNVQAAEEILAMAPETRAVEIYNSMLLVYANAGEYEKAMQFGKTMLALGIASNAGSWHLVRRIKKVQRKKVRKLEGKDINMCMRHRSHLNRAWPFPSTRHWGYSMRDLN